MCPSPAPPSNALSENHRNSIFLTLVASTLPACFALPHHCVLSSLLGWQSDALAPESFVGVNAPAHIAALEALYTEVNPDKLAQIPLMWDKFGAGIWQALVPKYPHVRRACPAQRPPVCLHELPGCVGTQLGAAPLPRPPSLPPIVLRKDHVVCALGRGVWEVGNCSEEFGAGYRCDARPNAGFVPFTR